MLLYFGSITMLPAGRESMCELGHTWPITGGIPTTKQQIAQAPAGVGGYRPLRLNWIVMIDTN
jgi:hypothetical protein